MTALLEILKDHSAITALIAMLSAFMLLSKVAKGWMDFQYDYFVRRHLQRVTELKNKTNQNSQLYTLLDKVCEAETFRIATGIRANPQKSSALMYLFNLGYLSTRELRSISKFVEPHPTYLFKITISPSERAFSYLSIGFALFSGMYFLILSLVLIMKSTFAGQLAGSLIMVFGAFFYRLMASDFYTYKKAKSLQKTLFPLSITSPSPLPETCSENSPLPKGHIPSPH